MDNKNLEEKVMAEIYGEQLVIEDLQEDKNLEEKLVTEIYDKQLVTEEKQEGKIMHYIKIILCGASDQILALGLALILFMISDLILGVLGYEIVAREEMFLIMFIISNVLYYPISQEVLKGKTVGRKLILR